MEPKPNCFLMILVIFVENSNPNEGQADISWRLPAVLNPVNSP